METIENRKEEILKRLKEVESKNLLETDDSEIQSEVTKLVHQLALINHWSLNDIEKELIETRKKMSEAAGIMQELVVQNKLMETFIKERGLDLKYQWFALKMTK